MKLVVLLLATSSVVLATNLEHWDNDFDHPLNFQCGDDSAIVRVKSIHSNHHEDRRFELFCARVLPEGTKAKCRWTNYVNAFDQLVHFTCPGNAYINGMHSIHNNHHEDRIWKYRCCSLAAVDMLNCELSGWTNQWDQIQDYKVPKGYVIKGSVSMHNNHREDRLFDFFVCKAVRHRDETPKPKHLLDYLLVGQEGVNGQEESTEQQESTELGEDIEQWEEME